MAKEAYYFSHDANARQDPKISEMMSVYGVEGYGRYWILVELLREQADFTLNLTGKYTFHALALQMHCTADAAESFVKDCINEFALFESDGECFWSNSLIRRMAIKEEISRKRKQAADARWSKNRVISTSSGADNASAMQMHSISNANGMQGKEKKEKERKEKERFLDSVFLTKDEYDRLVQDYGKPTVDSKIEDLDNYIGSKGKRYKDHNKTLRGWLKKDVGNRPLMPTGSAQPKPYVHDINAGED